MRAAAMRIFVGDLARAREFYGEKIGLAQTGGAVAEEFLVFDGGGIDIIIEPGADEPELMGRFVGLSFRTEDIAAEVARLRERGVRVPHDPERQAWGGLLAHFMDEWDNILTLVEM